MNNTSIHPDNKVVYVYKAVQNILEQKFRISVQNITLLTTNIMKIVEEVVKDKNKGVYKKNIVLAVLQLLVKNEFKSLSQKDCEFLLLLIETMVPSMIDTMVGLSKGILDIGKSKKCFSFCCN